ncbi:MAG: hypothetical protein C0394_08055 [Syntrophus sp. (in: bacteria)]|jgi:excisionase family DNA binding protein|nr:hypothetical protein [Syntrophus sp. (in: bacteria)]
MEGWGKIKEAAKYAGIRERTMRGWLQKGLRHARMPTGTVLIRYRDIDDYLEQFCGAEHRVDRIVDNVIKEFAVKRR